jgi:hypothetical protein
MMLNIYDKNLKYIFLLSLLIFGLFLESTPEYVNFLLIVFIILNTIFFFKSVIIYFNNLFTKEINIEKLILLILILSFLSILINFQGENNFTLKQIIRDYISFFYIFIPYLFLKLNLSFKDLRFITFSVVLMGYIILTRVVIFNFLTYSNFIFHIQDLSYLQNDVSILFSLNFLSIYFFYNRKYYLFSLFFLQYVFFVYFMQHSGSIIPVVNFIFIILVLILNLIGKYLKIFELKIPSYFIILIFFLLLILIFNNNSLIEKLLNNRQYEFEYFKNYFLNNSLPNIFFGQGLGNKFVLDYISAENISFLHNFLLYMILKFGFLGFIFLSIYFSIISKIYKLNFNYIIKIFEFSDKSLTHISFILILLFGLVFTTFYKSYSYWILFSIVIMNINLKKNEKLS